MNLFPNEELHFHRLDAEGTTSTSDDQINEKYIKGDVRIVTEQARYPLGTIVSLIESEKYHLNPEFQRRHRWNTEKQSRLIESFIMNVPIPPIFLYEVRLAEYEVMDGLQRLTAISEFYTNKLVLQGLTEWSELNGRRYSDLPEQIKNGVNRRYLSSIILLQETAKSDEEAQRLKQLVFERLNSGGIRLEPQEARNAIYNGALNQLCIRLARNKYLCRMWNIPEPSDVELESGIVSEECLRNEAYRRMEDVELVLRFFAYRQRLQNPKGALKEYLDAYLKHGNSFPPEVLYGLEDVFTRTIRMVYEVFGAKAFWLWRPRTKSIWNWFSRPALTAYEPIMYSFSQYIDQQDNVLQKRDQFRDSLHKFYEKNYESFGGRSTTNTSNITDRNNVFSQYIKDILEGKDVL